MLRLAATAVGALMIWLLAAPAAHAAPAGHGASRGHAATVSGLRGAVNDRSPQIRDTASDGSVAVIGVAALAGVLLVGGGMFLRAGRRREVSV